MATQTPIKYNSTNKKHELFAPTDTIPSSVIPSETIVDFSVNADPNTGGTTFSPNTPATADIIYTSTIDNSTWIWNGSSYVTYTPPSKTEWFLANTTNDAGGNKTSAISRTGRISVGTSTDLNTTTIHSVTSGSNVFIGTRYGDNPNSSGLVLRKSRGTESSPSAIQLGDLISSFSAQGYDGTSFAQAAGIRASATDAWTTSAHGTNLLFNIVPRGQISSSVRPAILDENGLSITKFGSVSTGVTPSPTEALDIYGNVKFSQALMPNNQAGTAGQVLISSGAGVAPVWSAPLAVLKTGLPINADIFQPSISYAALTNYVEVRGAVQSWTNTDATRSAYFEFHVGTQGGVDTGANASWVIKINAYAKIGSAPSLVNPDLGSNPDVIENGEFQHYSGFSTGSRVMQSRAATLKTMIVPPGQTLYYQVGHDYYVNAGSITIVYMYTGISPRMVFLVP